MPWHLKIMTLAAHLRLALPSFRYCWYLFRFFSLFFVFSIFNSCCLLVIAMHWQHYSTNSWVSWLMESWPLIMIIFHKTAVCYLSSAASNLYWALSTVCQECSACLPTYLPGDSPKHPASQPGGRHTQPRFYFSSFSWDRQLLDALSIQQASLRRSLCFQ